MSTLFDFKSWCETNGLKKDTTNLLTEQDLNTKEAIVLITLHRVGRNKTGNYDDPWSAQTSTQSDRHVTKRLSKRGANRYGAPFVSKLFVNVMFNVVPTYPWNVPVIEWTNHRYFSPWYHFTVRDVTFSSLISCYRRDVCNIFYLHHFTAVAWCDIYFLDIFSLLWWTRPFLLGGAFCIYCFYTTLITTSCQVTRLFTGTLYFLFRDCLPRVWK